ncbi:unnamed protein product, partial [Prorocentrum cordatum]
MKDHALVDTAAGQRLTGREDLDILIDSFAKKGCHVHFELGGDFEVSDQMRESLPSSCFPVAKDARGDRAGGGAMGATLSGPGLSRLKPRFEPPSKSTQIEQVSREHDASLRSDEILDPKGKSEYALQQVDENAGNSPHPPWMQLSGANVRATYTFCRLCNVRTACCEKTEEEKAGEATRRMAKTKSAQMREEVKQMVAHQVKQHEKDMVQGGSRAPRPIMQSPPPNHGLDPISELSTQAPAHLRGRPKGGCVPIKAAPTIYQRGHIHGASPLVTAPSDMTGAALPQRWMNEREFQIMSEMINRPAMSDDDRGRPASTMVKLASTMVKVMQRAGGAAAEVGARGESGVGELECHYIIEDRFAAAALGRRVSRAIDLLASADVTAPTGQRDLWETIERDSFHSILLPPERKVLPKNPQGAEVVWKSLTSEERAQFEESDRAEREVKEKYVREQLSTVHLDKERRSTPDFLLTRAGVASHRAAVAQVQWLARESRRRPLVDTITGRLRYWEVPCEYVAADQECPCGDMCPFAHTQEEVSYHAAAYKTKLCDDPGCRAEDACCLAHGESELRTTAEERYSFWSVFGCGPCGVQ